MEEKKELKEFKCRNGKLIRCGNPIFRDNLGDFLDYPDCEWCQEQEDMEITRLDNGQHS